MEEEGQEEEGEKTRRRFIFEWVERCLMKLEEEEEESELGCRNTLIIF